MEVNFLTLAIAAFIPLLVGFIWYGPFLFQKTLMKLLGHSEDPLKKTNLILIFTLSYLFSFSLAFFLQFIVIHQTGVYSSLLESGANELTGDRLTYFDDFMAKYGSNYRSFKHGVLHGVLVALFLILPILATQAMLKKKPIKYLAINAGYWIISIALMGDVVCKWGF
jgi:hypothetical protein